MAGALQASHRAGTPDPSPGAGAVNAVDTGAIPSPDRCDTRSGRLVNAIAFFGLAGLLAGLAMTWWHRRSLPTDPAA